MALKRLDEEFELRPGTQLLPYMKRLLPSLEGRFQAVEAEQDIVNELAKEIRAAALLRMNEILIPATEDIIAVTKLGFLLGPVSTPYTMVMGYMAITIDEGPQRNSFTPSPYLIIEHSINDYAIARLIAYHQADGLLEMTVTAIHGNPEFPTSMVSSTPGMADSTKIYHDAVGPMHDEVVTRHDDVVVKHQEIIDAAEALEEAGLDLFNYVRRDGTVPFTAAQRGVHPVVGSNDVTLATTAWSRARMQEYAGQAMQRTGDTMTGPLILSGPPSAPLQAATKSYVDAIIGAGGIVAGPLTHQYTNPVVRLNTTGPNQNRIMQGDTTGVPRWQVYLGNSTPEGTGNTGADFVIARYSNTGILIDSAFSIARGSGTATLKQINCAGLDAGSNPIVGGDITAKRADNTGVIYLGSAYHQWNGSTHIFSAGALTVNGGITCNGINTNGNAATVWGMTSHGHVQINSSARCTHLYVQSGGPMIQMEDTDYASMYVHTNGGIIGFLNYNQNWIQYTNIHGQVWTPAYGWLHEYVYYNSGVQDTRWVHAGDIDCTWHYYQWAEWGGAAITGLSGLGAAYGGGINTVRSRHLQHLVQGGWYTSGWAS